MWIDDVVDGVAIKKHSIDESSEFETVFGKFMEYELEGLKDREDMGTGFGDPFNDTSDVSLSNAYLSSGALRNTETPAVAATAGSNVVPTMGTSHSSGGYTVFTNYGEYGNIGYQAFDNNNSTAHYNYGTNNVLGFYRSSSVGITGIKIRHASDYAGHSHSLNLFYIQGSNSTISGSGTSSTQANASWTTIKTCNGGAYYRSAPGEDTFMFGSPQYYRAYRILMINSHDCSSLYCFIYSLEFIGTGTPYQPAYPNAATITLDSYNPAEALSAVKVKLWLENFDSSSPLSCGNSGSDKVEAYLSYNGNSTFSSALDFPAGDVKAAYSGSNIYIFTSEEVDVSGVSISGLGLRVRSFARSVAPNFKLHGALVVGRPITGE